MNEFTSWTTLFYNSLQVFGEQIMSTLPAVIGAIFILLVGWLFAKLISSAITKLLIVLKFDAMAEKVNVSQLLEKANVALTPSKLVGRFIYWLLLLMVIMTASDALGWQAITKEISNLLGYLPQMFVAIVFFIIGIYIASFVRDIIAGATSSIGISTGKIISKVVYYFLFMVVTLTALEQAQFDTSIITSNLMLLIGTIMVAAGISYGFASRDVLSNILAGYFSRKSFQAGQIIELENVKGTIIDATSISITVKVSDEEQVIIPMHKLITNNVKVFKTSKNK